MIINISYGNELFNIAFPRRNLLSILYPSRASTKNEKEKIAEAIKKPIDSKSLGAFLNDAKEVLVIVNDGNRPTPTAKVLGAIYGHLRNWKIRFLIATGVHEAPTIKELKHIFGRYYDTYNNNIFIHDTKRTKEMKYLGKSRHDTEIWINKRAIKADRIISISSVEPHYFAGFTGGRKSFLPGIAGYKTIEQNHRFALTKNARTLRLESNPIHEDMIDAIKQIGEEKIFSIQLVLDHKQRIYETFAGNIHGTFCQAVKYATKAFCVKISKKADIVVTLARPPFDRNLYQTMKAIENGRLALKKNGILIVVAPCQNGLGPPNFSRLFRGPKSLRAAVRHARYAYRLGDHNAVNLAGISKWAQIWLVSEISGEALRNALIQQFHSIQTAVDTAIKQKGQDARITFLINGSLTVPIFEKS